MWLGIDDTDSPSGGCTTHLLSELLAAARERGIDLLGYPRLVRLNPNVPWKTRGNAALSAHFGHGRGPTEPVGEIAGRPIVAHRRGVALPAAQAHAWIEDAWAIVRKGARRSDEGTDPALVASRSMLPASWYWRAVREIVEIEATRRALVAVGAEFRTDGSERGLVGAAASIAWPARQRTYELISYRAPERVGTPRSVDARSVRRAQSRHRSLFLCYDERTRRLLVAPHTPCPILFGLRSRSPGPALEAREEVESEPVDRWVLFATNQGTGDHLRTIEVDELAPMTSGRIVGAVSRAGASLRGGHVTFTIVDGARRELECVAYEPTKTLPRVARHLENGDRVVVWGSRDAAPVLRVEGIEVLRWSPQRGALRPPRCEGCERASHSLGRQRGYRCRGCGRRWPPEAGRRDRSVPPAPTGTYHPTPSARRHLAPLGPPAGRDGFALGRAV
ncbi:MAG: TiaS agmantine-binding domain-containing protein [Thermoplasmata archaeon]